MNFVPMDITDPILTSLTVYLASEYGDMIPMLGQYLAPLKGSGLTNALLTLIVFISVKTVRSATGL